MKISLNWIKDYIEVRETDPQRLMEAITLSTCEVEGYEETGKHLHDIVVAQVKAIKKHPEAEKLSLVTIDYGKTDELEVVCGASNFDIGDKVAFAGLGTVFPDGFTIKKAKIRGVESIGMLCAEDELGFSDDHEGLMILEQETEIGMPLSKLFPDQVDLILEVDNKSITHRPDLWGHYGFARELGAVFRVPVKPYPAQIADYDKGGDCPIKVEVNEEKLVYRYSGLSLDRAQIKPSPQWMQHRLTRVGLRPINNAVDVTNYVMLDLGQPMHAFDQDKIPGNLLKIGMAKEGEKLMTLYEKEVTLTAQDLLISDEKGPNVLAGVIGGMESGVSEATGKIFLEAACWDAVTIRRTTSRVGLRTDSSQRFEKTLDPSMTELAIARAVDLLKLTCPEIVQVGGFSDFIGATHPARTIEIEPAFIRKRLGKQLEQEEMKDIFTRLGFGLTEKGDSWSLEVPSYRATKDVAIKEDLVEEIGRIHGFNNIPPASPTFPIEKPNFNPKVDLERTIQGHLASTGFFEVYNYPMTCDSEEARFQMSMDGVMRMINPVAETQDRMRSSLLPHFASRMRNLQKEELDFDLFELGRSYKKTHEGEILERNLLILGCSATKGELGKAFYRLKAALAGLFNHCKLGEYRLNALGEERAFYQHKHIGARLEKGGRQFGEIYQFTPSFLKGLELRGEVAIAEIDLDLFLDLAREDYFFKDSSKYPPVFFELSVVVPERTSFGSLKEMLLGVGKRVNSVKFLGLYDLGDGTGSMSVSISFRAADKTLDPEEVKALQDKCIKTLNKAGYQLR